MSIGKNKMEYEVVEGWEQLPEGWSFVEVAGVATDSMDRVYAFNRGEHPMIIFDRDGKFLDAWGEDVFTNAHGIFIGPDDTIYCADNFDHTVRLFKPDGELILTLGDKDKPSDTGFEAWTTPVKKAAGPFNMVTNVAIGPDGHMYVADGYGNARVHRFSPNGNLELSWGAPGSGPGQFKIPHAIAVDRRGTVYVADRENSRIQVFTGDGEFLAEWAHVKRPDDLYIDKDENLFVAELGFKVAHMPNNLGAAIPPHEPASSVAVLSLDGEIQQRFGGHGLEPGNFYAPHGIWADSRGDLYVSEGNYSAGGKQGLIPLDGHVLQKFVRLNK